MAITVFIACAAAIYYSLPLITNCTSPILLVTSRSMNPTYEQGDILIL
jgi:signal peptidase I